MNVANDKKIHKLDDIEVEFRIWYWWHVHCINFEYFTKVSSPGDVYLAIK